MTDRLKPCLFCGGRLVKPTLGIIGAEIVYIKCGNLKCRAIVIFDNDACNLLPEEAITMWDRRARS